MRDYLDGNTPAFSSDEKVVYTTNYGSGVFTDNVVCSTIGICKDSNGGYLRVTLYFEKGYEYCVEYCTADYKTISYHHSKNFTRNSMSSDNSSLDVGTILSKILSDTNSSNLAMKVKCVLVWLLSKRYKLDRRYNKPIKKLYSTARRPIVHRTPILTQSKIF